MYESDKIDSGLFAIYEQRFAHLRDVPISYLEIGIARGGSLLWAREFFQHPESRILGVDKRIAPMLPSGIGQRICNQNDHVGLARIGFECGPFDIIIDDGSHLPKETRTAFKALWPFVGRGGYYVIEDWTAPFTHGDYYNGIELVVTDIARELPRYGIVDCAILANPNCSLAIYRKR